MTITITEELKKIEVKKMDGDSICVFSMSSSSFICNVDFVMRNKSGHLIACESCRNVNVDGVSVYYIND